MSPLELSVPPPTREPDARALREPRALMRQQRRVGRERHDDRAHAGLARPARLVERRVRVAQHFADRVARDAQRRALPVVRLHERADRPAARRFGDDARRGADAALELVADHAGAAADAAFRDRARTRGGERLRDVPDAHVLPPDVVQESVERLHHDRHAPVHVLALARAALRALGGDERIAHDADVVRVRIGDRRRQQPRLANPFEPGRVAVAVEHVNAREARLVARARRAARSPSRRCAPTRRPPRRAPCGARPARRRRR